MTYNEDMSRYQGFVHRLQTKRPPLWRIGSLSEEKQELHDHERWWRGK